MLKRLFESRSARVISTAVLLLLALGAIAAAWAAPGRSRGPEASSDHGPPAHSNSVHNRGDKPDRTAFGSGCEYGAAVAHWASGKSKDTSHCENGGTQGANGSSNKSSKAKSKSRDATAGPSGQNRGDKEGLGEDEEKAEETEVEKPDVEETPSPSPTPSDTSAL